MIGTMLGMTEDKRKRGKPKMRWMAKLRDMSLLKLLRKAIRQKWVEGISDWDRQQSALTRRRQKSFCAMQREMQCEIEVTQILIYLFELRACANN